MNTLTDDEPSSQEIPIEQGIRTCRAAVEGGRSTEDMGPGRSDPDWNIVRGED
ncbi:hypothetical protein ACQEVG_17640 [Streptomyces sp. CA-135486]|uniref:hypothetical protein n=1 Tax=Streptomyces sp. CA-135486 TaxID=3240049 RepID=UPI003D921547